MIQIKHSRAAGAAPNLMPGEVGWNLHDGLLWLRAAGRRVGLDVAAIAARAIPAAGALDAPLVMTDAGPAFDAALCPASVVGGTIAVDLPPPAGKSSVPGFVPRSAQPVILAANDVRAEWFYVASDSIVVSHLFVHVEVAPGALRVGLLEPDGTVLFESAVTPAVGLQAVACDVALTRGDYRCVVWSDGGRLTGVAGGRREQGWSFDGDTPVFAQADAGSADLSVSFADLPAMTPVTSADPGEVKTVMLRW